MKAKELIKILKENLEAEVVVTTSNFEQGHSNVALTNVSRWKMKRVSKRFIDAFDHGQYNADVYELSDAGQEVFVLH